MQYLVTTVAIVVWTMLGFYVGDHMGYQEGFNAATKEVLKTNPPSEQLEMTCAGLWVGQQNRKHWEKNK